MVSSPLLARLSKAIGTIPHGFRLAGVGAMAVMLVAVAVGFGTNLIIGNNNHDAYAQESQEEITTHYDTGLISCSNDNTPQRCDVPFRVTIETSSVLKVGITVAPETCSSTNNYVSVDGDEDTFGGTFIGRAGYSAIGDDSRTIPPYDFGTVESGSHTLDIWVEGIQGGCNQGTLYAWMGTLTVITSEPPEEDTIPPVITVLEDMTVEATGPDGAEVSFEEEPSATDEVDGPVVVTCDYNSGDTFPIGETVVTCSAEDAAGNPAEETFTITVQDSTDPDVEITQVVDRRNRVLEEGDTTPTPYIRATFEATDAVGVENIECSLDGQDFTACTSPVVYDRLSRGTHQVTVRATDEAGNTGEDQFLFTVGSPPPPGRQ